MTGGDKNSDKLVTIVLAIVIILCIGTLVYVNIPQEKQTTQKPGPEVERPVLTISYGSESFNYTLDELIETESFTGSGGFIKRSGTVVGPNNYTGVRISTLLNDVSHLPQSFTLEATASDGYTVNYTYDEIKGHVMVYTESGGETGIGNLTMIIAYKENGVLLNESTGGPLRVAF
ncbi:MAG: molybdopterin-dependent oxidoreductase, partial [Thermoplasmata archaeon]|nr:molybdopterin-dependent oxidoreductase [Thermoplasmata archaeon]